MVKMVKMRIYLSDTWTLSLPQTFFALYFSSTVSPNPGSSSTSKGGSFNFGQCPPRGCSLVQVSSASIDSRPHLLSSVDQDEVVVHDEHVVLSAVLNLREGIKEDTKDDMKEDTKRREHGNMRSVSRQDGIPLLNTSSN